MTAVDDPVLACLPSDVERGRYRTLLEVVRPHAPLFRDRRVLDYGAGWAASSIAMLRIGARDVVGVEPDRERVEAGQRLIQTAAPSGVTLFHVPDTRALPFPDGAFAFALANGVLEHIPQPRTSHLRELWRVITPGGHLLITETPNKYFPKELHTTEGLWFNHWLPRDLAHRRAVRRGRFRAARTDWASSGWRGVGYYELKAGLSDCRPIFEMTRWRHRVLCYLGLPTSLIDPSPIWLFEKRLPSAGS